MSDITLCPDLPRFLAAAREAALDPDTWAPAIGAGIMSIDDWDGKVSTWACGHHPVFGSRQKALDASDWLRDGLSFWSYITTAFPPYEGNTTARKVGNKSIELLVNFGTFEAVGATTDGLKRLTDRTRPDGSNRMSFPSAHASRAFTAAAFASANLRISPMAEPYDAILAYTGRGAAWLTGWARIEGGKHYPTDVLASACLANFFTVLIHRTFISREREDSITIAVIPIGRGIQSVIRVNF
ncbi:MAG: phosphatase PAP2 family protein [Candidatus Erginobacter occultus]|nr:phosphatase PAP2 family protein [Candidatus Erginobacter occultus]